MSESETSSTARAQRHCLNAARGLLLLSLVYVTWRFGGVDPVTLLHVNMLLLATAVLAILGQPRLGFQARPLPVLLFVVVALSVAWPIVQTIQLPPSVYNAVATGQHEIDRNLVDRVYEATFPVLRSSIDETIESASDRRTPRRSISVVRSLTKDRISQWMLMAAYLVLSALLFDSRKSRKVFLWTLAINSGMIAVWGLIQRSTGSTDLLPGITRASVILPFGPFVYKNAGAAALIPGLAAAVGLLWARWLPTFGTKNFRSSKQKQGTGIGSSTAREHHKPFLVSICVITSAGLLMSYSRGAWLAAVVASIAILVLARERISLRRGAVLFGIFVVGCLSIVALTNRFSTVSDRMEEQLSPNYVYVDARWEHWQEGVRAAKKYFPVGSGLGTYGYATVAEQQADSRLWFREAHNHYLETVTEQGILGLFVLLVGGCVVIRCAHLLLKNKISRERSAIGLVGLSAMIAITVQSAIDFVILIPAVMFLFAALFGIVAQTYVSPFRKRTVRTAGELYRLAPRWTTAPAIWIVTILVCLALTQSQFRNRINIDRALRVTSQSSKTIPNSLAIEANLDQLNESIAQNPDRAELYQRRAYWHTVQMRVALRRASFLAGAELSWESTSPATLFQKIMAASPSDRDLIVDDMAIDPKMRQPLRSAIADSQQSIELNPLVPASHLSIALLAPTVGIDPAILNASLSRLALSNPRLQFTSGMIAHFTGDQGRMIDQWRRSLRGTSPELNQMIRLCLDSMSLKEVTENLIPVDRSVLLLPMIRSLDDKRLTQLRSDTQLHRLLEKRIQADPTRTIAQQHALLAQIATDLDQTSQAEKHWTEAVNADRTNGNYRYQYCKTLMRTENYDEVFKQCSLGQALEPERGRFREMVESARKSLKSTDR